MFDIGWQEMMVVGVVTLLIVGPKDIPKVIRTVRDGMKQVRGLAREFQSGMDDLVREADLEDTKKIFTDAKSGSIERTIRETVDPGGELEQTLDVRRDIEEGTGNFSQGSTTASAFSSLSGGNMAEAKDDEASDEPAEEKKPKSKTKTANDKKPASAKKVAVGKTTAKKTSASATKTAPKKSVAKKPRPKKPSAAKAKS